MDELARYNRERWEALAAAGILFTRPWLDLDPTSARERVDPAHMIDRIEGRNVLCLAGGGGQQSAAFALLGANVSVLDLTESQLERDRATAEHYGVQVETLCGDMRDLSHFADASFDVVWHAHSLNFVPDARVVFREVARVLRPSGLYRLHCANPFTHGVDARHWNGQSYPLESRYVDGEIQPADPDWEFHDGQGQHQRVRGPREFRHTLATLLNGLLEQRFQLLGCWEDTSDVSDPEPGSWEHYKSVVVPWLTFWCRAD